MNLMPWIKPKEATTAELEAQREAALDAKDKADKLYDEALADFDARPDDAASRKLATARDAKQGAADHVGRAERLLAAARERDRQQAEANARAELKQLENDLADMHQRRVAALADAEFEALRLVIARRQERWEHARLIRNADDRAATLRRQLGVTHAYRASMPVAIASLSDRLVEEATALGPNDPRHVWAMQLARGC